jgi:RNA polymerase sigma-70 factor (ECF subfamily)
MLSPEEKQFVEQLKSGDNRAFTRLVTQNQDRIYSYLLRMLGNSYEASEVTQEVFTAAFRFMKHFRGDSSLVTWLLKIASNMYKNRIRYNVRRKRGREASIDDLVEQPNYIPIGGRPESPEGQAASRELEIAIHAAIAKLPADFREVLVLRDLELLPYSDIEQLTGLAEGTVKSRIHRARQYLAELLSEHLDGEKLS